MQPPHPRGRMGTLRLVILLVIILSVQCQYISRTSRTKQQYGGTSFGTSRTRHNTSYSSGSNIEGGNRYGWSGSTQFAKSRTSITPTTSGSRYHTYHPLDVYRHQYGSELNRNKTSTTSTSQSNSQSNSFSSGSRSNTVSSGSHGSSFSSGSHSNAVFGGSHSNSGTGRRNYQKQFQGSYGGYSNIRGSNSRREGLPESKWSLLSTVPPHIESTNGLTHYETLENKRKENHRNRTRYFPPRGSGGKIGIKKSRITGEGYGTAYLEWSEYGLGCTCDECGTRDCKHYTSVCECHENVIGDHCDQCATDHWGFASCQGCQHCQCGFASTSSQCDEGTGQCDCRSGVTGQRCDQCKPGYWNYTNYGCQECSCRRGFSVGVSCDPVTGQCSCLQGVIGANCDRCPYRW
ncbi:unnamed protein product, partial [Meganyctiphanes norvegica]